MFLFFISFTLSEIRIDVVVALNFVSNVNMRFYILI